MPAQSCCKESEPVSSDFRTAVVPLRMCFGGLFRAFFLPFLAGDAGPPAEGDSLQTGDLGLLDVGELPKGARCLSACERPVVWLRKVEKLLGLMDGPRCCCVCNMLSEGWRVAPRYLSQQGLFVGSLNTVLLPVYSAQPYSSQVVVKITLTCEWLS